MNCLRSMHSEIESETGIIVHRRRVARQRAQGMSKQQDTWLEAALRGLDEELGGAIGPLSDQDMVTAKAMVLATLRKSITTDPAGFRKALATNAEAAAVMMGVSSEPVAAPAGESATAAAPAG